MAVPNQRDPDLTVVVNGLLADVDETKKTLIARWGRIPNVTADPTSPPDGAVWLRSDREQLRYRTNGATFFTPGYGPGPPPGVGSNGEWYTDTTNNRVYRS